MEINLGIFTLGFESPVWLLIIPFFLITLWYVYSKRQQDAFAYGGFEYAIASGIRPASKKLKVRSYLIVSLLLILGLTWSDPQVRFSRPLLIGPVQELLPVYLIALDVSGSMTEPLGGYVVDGQLNLDGPTRFQASRDKIYSFAESHSEASLGLILFSVQPMLVRWPTVYTEFDFKDVLGEGMRFTNPNRQRTSQLARFAGGTATRAGLTMAREALINQASSSRALILIGDLIDNIEEVVDGVDQLSDDGIYTYAVALDSQPENLELFTSAFEDRENVRIYPVNSLGSFQDAFEQIEENETRRLNEKGGLRYVHDIRWLVSFLAFLLSGIIFVLFESVLHRTRS